MAPRCKVSKTRKLLLNNIDNNFIYVLNPKNRLETTLNVVKLAFPSGTNIFKDIRIPAENSTDNKEHVVQSEEEFYGTTNLNSGRNKCQLKCYCFGSQQ